MTTNQKVVGSNPAGLTKKPQRNQRLWGFSCSDGFGWFRVPNVYIIVYIIIYFFMVLHIKTFWSDWRQEDRLAMIAITSGTFGRRHPDVNGAVRVREQFMQE